MVCTLHEIRYDTLELALERAAATFDVLGAESMGQIGYVLALAMQSVGCTAVPILTQVVVDQYSEAFKDPSKFVGPIYGSTEAQALAQSLGYVRSSLFSSRNYFAICFMLLLNLRVYFELNSITVLIKH
jgi:carbamate kinase